MLTAGADPCDIFDILTGEGCGNHADAGHDDGGEAGVDGGARLLEDGGHVEDLQWGGGSARVRPGGRSPLVLQKVPSEANPKVRNHGEGPY